jgi:hypothetical protein
MRNPFGQTPSSPAAAGADPSALVAQLTAQVAGAKGAAGAAARGSTIGRAVTRVLMHLGFLVIAVGCFAAWAHFKVAGNSTASLVSLVAAGGFALMPVRDLSHAFFSVEGRALHLLHGLGGLALIGLPLTGVVSGGRALTGAAMAPFAIMGAAQAVMHQDHPRNAQQAAALRNFASSLPEVAQFAGSDLTKPANAMRAMTVLTDIVGKAEALGQTELQSDPGFQSALRQVSTRMGANLGLDAVDVELAKLAKDPATAAQAAALQQQVARARKLLAGGAQKS